MTEIKSFGTVEKPNSPPACRCQCAFEGPWFPLELQIEQVGYDAGGCACGCTQANDFFTYLVAKS
jgi:hypothetical protein